MPADTLGRAWDAFDAYLFDIDGTLMHCTDAVHYFAFNDALTAIAGHPLTIDGVVAHGNVDIGIIRDAFARAGIPESTWRPRLGEMLRRMGTFVSERRGDLCIDVLPQVREVLGHLRTRGAILGTATGNLEVIGRAKLDRVGLLDLFHFGGWSDASETRGDVFRHAAAKARELTARNGAEPPALCVVGDTPADVRAARENGLKVIAVATGIYTFETLAAEHPDLLIRSLEDLLPAASVLIAQPEAEPEEAAR
ncbi:MAG TPA: HAD family hydrolase [Acidobacteriaceae bacterium]|jgi:phosphoglycolate phosphatase-like HAD superfamily hydrolase|nr:HAD family hydrolase [Acidobacteriaceae bacterium]